MGIDIKYKVRAERTTDRSICITEKGLLRFLRTSKSREALREAAYKEILSSKDEIIYTTYVWDPIDKTQIACFGRKMATDIGWEAR